MLDQEFIDSCLYEEGALLLDEVVEVDKENSRVVARMPVHADLPITRHQRVHPRRHPRHVSGGLMVHMTGIVGYVHFYYVLGHSHADGWTGYGARIYEARFHTLAEPGAPMLLSCEAVRIRRIRDKIHARYRFRFTQEDRVVYEGEQAAMWLKIPDEDE